LRLWSDFLAYAFCGSFVQQKKRMSADRCLNVEKRFCVHGKGERERTSHKILDPLFCISGLGNDVNELVGSCSVAAAPALDVAGPTMTQQQQQQQQIEAS
jgi:hypothetical protein